MNNIERIEQIVAQLRNGHIGHWEAESLMILEGMTRAEANAYLEHTDMRG